MLNQLHYFLFFFQLREIYDRNRCDSKHVDSLRIKLIQDDEDEKPQRSVKPKAHIVNLKTYQENSKIELETPKSSDRKQNRYSPSNSTHTLPSVHSKSSSKDSFTTPPESISQSSQDTLQKRAKVDEKFKSDLEVYMGSKTMNKEEKFDDTPRGFFSKLNNSKF